ncbi:MAG: GAF domain-containing protein [Deltaproteobacteria bacterium]
MAEELLISKSNDKNVIYQELLPQLWELVKSETDVIANMANISAGLHHTFGWLWVGFYLVRGEELVLGPFQGPMACSRISYGKGVCGSAWQKRQSILVPDVEKFPGHIACSGLSVSEIVVPVFDSQSNIIAVLDVDSERYQILDETDIHYLEKIALWFAGKSEF